MSPRRLSTTSLQPLLYSAGANADEVVGAYAFSATLAVQDITGDAHSGVTASHIAKRLEGSAESEAYLFALTSHRAPRPLGGHGYPEITVDDLADIDAWVFISLPLLEDTGIIEASITLDAAIAPLPGEPVPEGPWGAALSLIDALSARLHRPIRHIWETHAVGAPSPAARIVGAAGYSPAYREEQATFSIGDVQPAAAEAPLPVSSIEIVHNMDFPAADLALFRDVLTAASRDYPRGELKLDTVEWTEQRVRDAGARLLDRGGNQVTAIAYTADPATGGRTAVGMAEAVHYDSDDDALMELGLIYVLPQHRRRGVGTAVVEAALAAAEAQWPGVETGYCSYPSVSGAAHAMLKRRGSETISATTAWQRK